MKGTKGKFYAPSKRRMGTAFALVAVGIAGSMFLGGCTLFGSKAGTPSTPAPTTTTTTTSKVDPLAQTRMYTQQLQSQVIIGDLAAGKLSSLTFSSPKISGDSATANLSVASTSGSTVTGTITFAKYDKAWYLSTVQKGTATASAATVATTAVDAAVVSTITEQQAQYQDMVAGLLSGGYTTITLGKAVSGSGTVTIPVTVSGGKLATRTGSIVLISKVINGSEKWFISSFR